MYMSCETCENNVLTFRTIQIGPFKTLMTALKEILLDTDICFTPEGMKIINMDKSHNIVVKLELFASNFEFYECKRDKIILGVNVVYLFKLINTIENGDALTIYVENNDYVDGVVKSLSLRFENGGVKQCKTQKLKLIETEQEELTFPNINYSSVIAMPSQRFQKIIRDLSFISDRVEIKSVGDELIFSCQGQFADSEIRQTEMEDSLTFLEKQSTDIVNQGVFCTQLLLYFIKCTNLCQNIELRLENDLPLMVKYDVASLGNLSLALVQLPPNF